MTGPLPGPDDTSTESLRRERGEDAPPDPRDAQGAAPVGPSSIGVVGRGPTAEPTSAELERQQAPPGDEGSPH